VFTQARQTSAFTDTELAVGDRFEIVPNKGARGLLLPAALAGPWQAGAFELEDDEGAPLRFDAGAMPLVLRLTTIPGWWATSPRAVWLEYRGTNQWRLLAEAATREQLPSANTVTRHGTPVELETVDLLDFVSGHQKANLSEFEIGLRAGQLATHAGFDQLMCLPLVRDMEILEHQVRTAKTVLRRLRGRALLCDEVGLGKTIEAGLVLSELRMRGLARSILVLAPPALIDQWQGEMRRKFSLELVSHDAPAFRERGQAAWREFDQVIASIHTAKREPHRASILARQWDLIVVDEAHHLRNRATQLWRFASELRKQFMLLLTATPVQNNLDELFNLVTLLEPGLLRTAKQFQKQFVDRKDKLTPRNVSELHGLLSEVMIRNRRGTVGLQFTRRWARTDRITMHPGEQALYHQVAGFVHAHLSQNQGAGALGRMALLSLQMALGSSSQAAAGTLRKLAEHANLDADMRATLAAMASAAAMHEDSAKVGRLLEILTEFPDKMVIFTQFLATQEMLAGKLRQAGHEVAVFNGSLVRLEKEAAVDRFRGPARLLLATESGSEGRNLQFAHAICNFDLPWNPMKIEQRIGRLSRIGQTHDVHVFNLVAAGTVEAAVLHLLEAKLNLFELVIGEIDMILGNLDEERDFQDVVADTWAQADDADDFSRRMEDLGNRLLAAKEAYISQREIDDRLFADRFAPDR
jgi:SNF2 family DNA or RNA helicase